MAWIETYIIANGFRGIGELTPVSGKIAQLENLYRAAREFGNLPLWVHAFFPLKLSDIQELLVLAQRYPTVPTIIGHLGGIYWLETLQAIRNIPSVYLDLSAAFTTIALVYAIKEYPDRTLFSSDAPYSSPLIAKTVLTQLIADRHIFDQVLGGNISRLLQLA